MAFVLVGLDDAGAGRPLVETVERAGHQVRWVGAMDVGPAGQPHMPHAIFVDGEAPGMDIPILSAAWRQFVPTPVLYLLGGPAVRQAAVRVRAGYLPKPVNAAAVVQELAKLERAGRPAHAPHAAEALRLLGVQPRGNPLEDAAWILAGAKQLEEKVVLEALRPHVLHYVTPTSLLGALFYRGTFDEAEAAFIGTLDGSRTVKRLVDAGGLEAARAARLVWALAQSGAAVLSREPPTDPEWPVARRTAALREDLRARTRRLRKGNAYEIIEVHAWAGIVDIDRACHGLTLRYAPEQLAGLDLGDCAPLADPLWKQINDARGILGDPQARQRYDAHLRALNGPSTDGDLERQRLRMEAQAAEDAFLKGQQALQAGEPFNAVADLAQAARRQPDEPDYEAFAAWGRYLAETARGQRGFEVAERERRLAAEAMKGRRPRPRALFALGLLCEAAGDLEAARSHLREALACDPRLAAAQKVLARLGG